MSKKEEMLTFIDGILDTLKVESNYYIFPSDLSIVKAIRHLIENMDKKPKVAKKLVEKWTENILATTQELINAVFVGQQKKNDKK